MKLKVCGMKYPDNIMEVASLLPTYMGFIFWEPSSRFFNGEIPENFPEKIKKTGVFVNAKIDYILEKVRKYKLDVLQLHGDESVDFCKDLRRELDQGHIQSIEFIKVFPVKTNFDFNKLKHYESCCDYFLFDTKGELPGGNGYTFDWSLLNNYSSQKPYFLSGGIGISKIEKLNDFFKHPKAALCHAIDVNSKFETAPGFKNFNALKTFKASLKNKN